MAKKSFNLKALTPCLLMNINGTNGLVLNFEYNDVWMARAGLAYIVQAAMRQKYFPLQDSK